MKLVYIVAREDFFFNDAIGVKKKIKMQVESFSRRGFNCYLIYRERYRCIQYCVNSNETNISIITSEQDYYENILCFCQTVSPDVIYSRHFLSNVFVDDFYKKLSEENKDAKMIIEFPTYPYDKEIEEEELLQIDNYYDDMLHKYFKSSVNYSNFNEINKIKSIAITNGIDFKRIPVNSNKEKSKIINLIAVANLAFYHGYDRIIEGMKHYYKNNKIEYEIIFHLVGMGAEYTHLIELSEKYNLTQKVKFYGKLYGKDLDNIFMQCDIAIGSLGMHRLHPKNYASSIKLGEYCARGIPFIFSHGNVFYDKIPYILKPPGDESPIDMIRIIDFYNEMYSIDNISQKIRENSEKSISWDAQIDKILKFVGM